MKVNTKMAMVLVFVMVFAVFATALADGGSFPTIPISDGPESWKREIQGNFTAKYVQFIDHPVEYYIEVVLWTYTIKNQKVESVEKTYSFTKTVDIDSKKLCDYTESYLIKRYARMAEEMGVVDDFKLLGAQMQGFPVLKELKILKKTNCGDLQNAMISGKLKIEVLPQ